MEKNWHTQKFTNIMMADKSHSSSDEEEQMKWQGQSPVWLWPNPRKNKKDDARLVSGPTQAQSSISFWREKAETPVYNKPENTMQRHDCSQRNPAHLVDYFKVDTERRRGIKATDFPLARTTNTKFLGVRRGIKKK